MLTDDPKKNTTTPVIQAAGSLKSDAVEDMAQHAGLAPPPRNRRSTDPKTPPTQALTDTNAVESTTGLRALLHSLLSKIIPKKYD